MKFTQNTPVVSPNSPNITPVQAIRNPMAYGGKDESMTAYAGAMGQVLKIAQQQQDDMDAADHMERRNKIMGNITERLYGEKGILTNGIGENAKGLTGKVTQVVQEEFQNGMKGANSRVRRSMAGTFNENMGNYQRIAAQQEGREFRKQKEANYGLSVDNSVNMAILNYQNADLLDSNINDVMRIVDWRAKDMGWNEEQRLQERRNVLTAVAGAAIHKAIEDNDLDTASIYNDRYGKYMNQKDIMQYQKTIRGEKRIQEEKTTLDDIFSRHQLPNGEYDYNAIYDEIDRLSHETKVVGGGSAYFADSSLNDEIMAAATKYKVDPALVAAVADAESNGNQEAVSSVGALGVMQLMPDTAASLGVDPGDRRQNIDGGAKYLRQLLDTFGGNEELAIAAYNAGPGAVKEAGNQVPSYKETINYVAKVKDKLKKYRAAGGNVNIDSAVNKAMGDIDKNTPLPEGRNGCAHAANFIVSYFDPWGKEQIEKGGRHKSYVPQLVADARQSDGPGVIDFDESQLRKGNMIVYKDPDDPEGMNHVVVYVGNGPGDYRYVGNSSDANGGAGGIIDDGKDYRQMSGMYPQYIIKTGGSGGGGHTVNAHDSGWADRMKRLAHARRQELEYRKANDQKAKLENYKTQADGLGAEGALQLVERLRNGGEDMQIVKALESHVYGRYDLTRRGNGGGSSGNGGGSSGRRNSKERIPGVTGEYGNSGKWYTNAQIDEANYYMAVYRNRLANDGDRISEDDQTKLYNPAAALLNDIENKKFTRELMNATAQAWSQTQDYKKCIELMKAGYDMSETDAITYLDHYLENNQEEGE